MWGAVRTPRSHAERDSFTGHGKPCPYKGKGQSGSFGYRGVPKQELGNEWNRAAHGRRDSACTARPIGPIGNEMKGNPLEKTQPRQPKTENRKLP